MVNPASWFYLVNDLDGHPRVYREVITKPETPIKTVKPGDQVPGTPYYVAVDINGNPMLVESSLSKQPSWLKQLGTEIIQRFPEQMAQGAELFSTLTLLGGTPVKLPKMNIPKPVVGIAKSPQPYRATQSKFSSQRPSLYKTDLSSSSASKGSNLNTRENLSPEFRDADYGDFALGRNITSSRRPWISGRGDSRPGITSVSPQTTRASAESIVSRTLPDGTQAVLKALPIEAVPTIQQPTPTVEVVKLPFPARNTFEKAQQNQQAGSPEYLFPAVTSSRSTTATQATDVQKPNLRQETIINGIGAKASEQLTTVVLDRTRHLAEKKWALLAAMEKGVVGVKGPRSTPLEPLVKDGGGMGVDENRSHVMPLGEAGFTKDMRGCAALVGVNDNKNLQYVVHVRQDLPTVALKRDILEKIGTQGTQFFIIPGTMLSTKTTVWTILSALGELDETALNTVQFKHFPESETNDMLHHLSVVVNDGQLSYSSESGSAGGGKFIQYTDEESEAQQRASLVERITSELGRDPF